MTTITKITAALVLAVATFSLGACCCHKPCCQKPACTVKSK